MAEAPIKNANHGLPEEDSYPGMMTDSITTLCGLVNTNNRRGRKRGRLVKKRNGADFHPRRLVSIQKN
jgi:hypothetical protein